METVFERDALFAEVWSSPITTLAKKYDLSDNGLRKICKVLGVPLPVRGHWARIAAGHQIKTPLLPPTKGPAQFVRKEIPTSVKENAAHSKDDQWLIDGLAFETATANFITVDTVLSNPHPLVKAAAKRVSQEIIELEKSRDRPKLRWDQAPSRRSGPSWNDYVSKGCVLDLPEDILPMRVSIEASDRALRIWDALIKACVARKMKVSISPRRLRVDCEHESIELRIAERLLQVPVPDGVFQRINRSPTGELRIYVCSFGAEKKFSDGENKPLETQINDVIRSIYRTIAEEKVRTVNRAEDRRVAAIIAERRNLELIRQQELQEQIAAEKRQQELLIAEAGAWTQAEAIRAYSANVMKAVGASGAPINDELQAWLTWSAAVAHKLDPTKKRIR